MSVFIKFIPFIELLLVLSMLGLSLFGYLSLRSAANRQKDQNQYNVTGKWVLPGLIVLSILAIVFLLMASLIQG